MSNKTLEKVLDELIKSQVFHVTFTGGEPLLNKSILFKGVESIIKHSIGCTVNTNLNGFSYEDGLILSNLGLKGILTSVASHNPNKHDFIMQTTGAHSRVMDGIDNAIKAGLKVACSMVVTEINKDDVVCTGKFLNEKGISTFYATCASPPLGSKGFEKYMLSNESLVKVLDDLKILEDKYGLDVGILQCYPLCSYKDGSKYHFASSKRCSSGTTGCTISSNGDIRPCTHSDEVFGNIKNGLLEAWGLMNDYRNGSKIPSQCHSCSFFPDCSAGCRVNAKHVNGKDNALDPYAEPKSINQITRRKIALPNVGYSDLFCVNQELKIRNEEQGVLIDDKKYGGNPVFITNDTYDLLSQLGNESFSIKTIEIKTGLLKKDSSRLCALLLKDKIITRV